MKKLLGFLIILTSFHVNAAELVRGLVRVNANNEAYLEIDGKTSQSYLIRAKNETAAELKRLKTDDYLVGTGNIINDEEIFLENISYVGLTEILGLWKSNYDFMDFENFSRVKFYDYVDATKVGSVTLNYTLTPAKGQSWRVYFTDGNSVTLATLILDSDKAQLTIFNSQTGQIERTLNLTRINSR